jgi:hypothetical protein
MMITHIQSLPFAILLLPSTPDFHLDLLKPTHVRIVDCLIWVQAVPQVFSLGSQNSRQKKPV